MRVYIGTFLIAFATLALEITLSRFLSVSTWYHLAFFAISTAMLGMTAGAVTVYLRKEWIERQSLNDAVASACMGFGISLPVALLLLCLIPIKIERSLMPAFSMLLVTAPANIYYLSAFHTPAYDNFQFLLLPASGEPVMFNVLHESECLVAARSHVRRRVAYPGWASHLDHARDLLVREGLAEGRIGLDKSAFFFSVRDYEGLIERLPRGLRLLPLALPAVQLAVGWPVHDRSRYRIAEEFGTAVLDSLPPGSHLVATDDNILFALLYMHLVEGKRPAGEIRFEGTPPARPQ